MFIIRDPAPAWPLQAQLILFFGSENGEISLNTKFNKTEGKK